MKRFFAATLAAFISASAYADSPEVSDWREAIERVHAAGGWKAYAREIGAPPSSPAGGVATLPELTLDAAIDRARSLDPNLRQALSNVSRDPNTYLALSDHQRSALTREAQLIADTQILYFSAIAAQERLNYQSEVAEVASIASELANRMRKVGNLNLLHQAEEQLSFAQTQKNISHARVMQSAAREALIRKLQLSGEAANFALHNRLPELPKQAGPISSIDKTLLTSDATHPTMLRVQSEARQAITARDEAYALAKHYRDEILPLQKRISEEHLLHYNGMIIGIFELLKDAKQQVHAVEGYLNALHAYWQAESTLAPKLFALREHFSQLRRDAWK